MTDLDFAEQLARRAHATQREPFAGAPYVDHLTRVAAAVDGDDAKTVAWLHDIIEDTPVTVALLRTLGFAPAIVRAVGLLTRTIASYDDYIAAIARAENPLARVVKLADLRDHLRADGPVISASLRIRYMHARTRLEAHFSHVQGEERS